MSLTLESVYSARAPDQMSWTRAHPEVSLELLTQAGLQEASRLIDVGGGASTLVDDLLVRGVRAMTVLDVSAAALDTA